jgi:hypothetical protein
MKEDHTPRKNPDSTEKNENRRDPSPGEPRLGSTGPRAAAQFLERLLLNLSWTFDGGLAMNTSDRTTHDTRRDAATDVMGRPRSAELHNDRTHDSTVDTDGKNREAARLAGDGPISPDEVTTSNATLDNSVPETPDGLAGFDSRPGGQRLLVATQPGYEVVDRGMAEPAIPYDDDSRLLGPRSPGERRSPGRIHFSLNHQRPTRVIELKPTTE